jgi:hypothetical protein
MVEYLNAMAGPATAVIAVEYSRLRRELVRPLHKVEVGFGGLAQSKRRHTLMGRTPCKPKVSAPPVIPHQLTESEMSVAHCRLMTRDMV